MQWHAIALMSVPVITLAWLQYYRHTRYLRSRYNWRAKKSGRKAGHIYFYRPRFCPPFVVKIGRADDPYQRISAQRTGHPFGTEILCVFITKDDNQTEAIIHNDLAFWRISPDNEWFWIIPVLHPIWWYIAMLKNKELTKDVNRSLMIRLPFLY